MACFLVPTAEAVITTIAMKAEQSKEKKAPQQKREAEDMKIPLSQKLRWLNYLLYGGAVLLAFEHLWHGEVVPWFPFLTAASNPADTATMLHEMATVGVSMAVLVTVVWAIMCLVADAIVRRGSAGPAAQAGGAA